MFTQLSAASPVIIPPTPEIVYDKVWIDLLTFQFPSPVTEGTLYARLVPCRDNPETGLKELKNPLKDGDVKVVTTDQIYYQMAVDPEIAMAFELILRSINKLGIQSGVLLDPTQNNTISSQ
jgi:hypothetical protein